MNIKGYNFIRTKSPCPYCEETTDFVIAFKYGEIEQRVYTLGQTVKWGNNSVGTPCKNEVIVEGTGGPCLCCGCTHLEFNIRLKSDVITELIPFGLYRESYNTDGFTIIKN